MHLDPRRLTAPLLAAALLSIGAAPAAALPFGAQNPLGSSLPLIETAERPSIASGDGRSLVVWKEQAFLPDFEDVDRGKGFVVWSINGRFVDGDSNPIGDPFLIGRVDEKEEPSRPDVAWNAAVNEFLVTWRGESEADGYDGVAAQRVGSDGSLLSDDPVEVNDADECLTRDVARVAWAPGDNSGSYLVVWDDDECGDGIMGVRLAGADAAVLDEDAIELSEGVYDADYPDVAHDPIGRKWFVVFDAQQQSRGSDESLFGTIVDLTGAVEGPTGFGGEEASRAAVAANTVDGGFAVAWGRQVHEQRIFSNGDIVARLFDGAGVPVGDEKEISPRGDGHDSAVPSIAHDPGANEYLIGWWQQTNITSRGLFVEEAMARRVSKALDPLDEPRQLAILEPEQFGRGESTTIFGAAQPVVTYDRSTCKYVSAFEIESRSRLNVASRGFDAPDCAAATTAPPQLSARDSTVRGVETVTAGSAASVLPRRCTSRRVFSIRLVSRKGRRYRSATVSVNGKVVKRLSGDRREALIDLEGLPKGTFTVRLTAKLADGKTLRYTRRYRTCTRKLKDSNRLNRKEAV